jgi:hypothetical protein
LKFPHGGTILTPRFDRKRSAVAALTTAAIVEVAFVLNARAAGLLKTPAAPQR